MKFKNKRKTNLSTGKNPFDMYMDYFFRGVKDKNPQNYKNKGLDMREFEDREDAGVLLGHSTVLLKTEGRVFIADPVLREGRVGPLGVLGPKNFKYSHKYTLDEIPKEIEGVLISHNHYDHLDYRTVKLLSSRTKKFFVPEGVGELLLKKGIARDKIVELGWYGEYDIEGMKVVLTPTRHFSGRGLFDGNKTLWGSWVIKGRKSIFFSGDTGYCEEFKKIGERYGPFDLTLIECGAYSKYWSSIHLMPEESVRVGRDLSSKLIIPIHNRKYDLSLHRWDEPLKRFKKEVTLSGIEGYKIPEIGEVWEY